MNTILSELTDAEIAQVYEAFVGLDEALCLLERAGLVAPDNCNLLALYNAAHLEAIARSIIPLNIVLVDAS